jgi:hypothetical protein
MQGGLLLGGIHDMFAQMESLLRAFGGGLEDPRRPGGFFDTPQQQRPPLPHEQQQSRVQVKVEEV